MKGLSSEEAEKRLEMKGLKGLEEAVVATAWTVSDTSSNWGVEVVEAEVVAGTEEAGVVT